MGTWGLEAGIAVLLVGLALPLAIGPMAYLHYRRHGRFAGWPAFLTISTFLYGWGLVAFTLFPLPDTNTEYCSIREGISYWQLRPFASLDDVLRVATDSGLVATLTSTTFLQVFFNVVLLVPLGMLLAYRYRKTFGFTVLAGLGMSLLIELTQGTGLWGMYACPYRLADVDDLITNGAGVAVGWLIGSALIAVLPDPDPPPVPDLDKPTVRRRMAAALLDFVALSVVGIFVQVAVNAVARVLAGPDFLDLAWLEAFRLFTGFIATGVALLLVMPLLRRDRATPGQIVTWLVPAPEGERIFAGRRVAAIRFAARWLPVLVAAYWQPLLVLGVVALDEIVAVIVRSDRRSLSAVAARSETVTRRWVTQGDR